MAKTAKLSKHVEAKYGNCLLVKLITSNTCNAECTTYHLYTVFYLDTENTVYATSRDLPSCSKTHNVQPPKAAAK